MRRLLTFILCVFMLSGVVMAQQMSDEQIIMYVQQGQAAGKSQQQITSELMRRGVTKEQVLRIKKKYEEGSSESDSELGEQTTTKSRKRKLKTGEEDTDETVKASQKKKKTRKLGETTKETDMLAAETEEATTDEKGMLMTEEELKKKKEEKKSKIFGHNLFTNRRLTFEPSVNIATPANYNLGPGDEVVIDIWGASENTIREVISPEGTIQVSGLGPVQLSGMTVKDANAYLQREFSKIYSGIGGNEPTSQIKLTLGDIRTIQISIMGEVEVPGTYTLSAFSSVFHALYRAGGVNEIGSLRSIKVVRNGHTVADLDVYAYIMKGKMSDDIRLHDGDVIIVKPYDSLVEVVGKVKRPMFYEMKSTEHVGALIDYTGGFTGDAYKKAVRVIRKSARERQVFNVDEMDFSVFRLSDGDKMEVDSVLDRYENRIEVRGAVFRPGLYQLDGKMNTVKQLIQKAEGLRGDAFLNRAIIDREHEDLNHEIISVDLEGLLKGTVPDIALQKNDVLYVPSQMDLREEQTVAIHGEVQNPGTFLYSSNMTIEDLVIHAGGLLESASTTRVSVTRRTKNPRSSEVKNEIGKTFTFDLKDDFRLESERGFTLEPFDEVFIRKSPAYQKQQNVTVVGEVLFGGVYALQKKSERISELVARAGGLTPDAYVKGARLVRTYTEEEMRRQEDVLRMAKANEGKDSLSLDKLQIEETYTVGIDLEQILANPKSDVDVVMREGDILYVPEYVSTVKISGSVMYPNTVVYQKGKNLKHYIEQAGGFGNTARKNRVYVVHMNGTVSRVKSRSTKGLEPGCEIIVPSRGERKRMSIGEILSLGSTTASIAAMVATLVNTFK